MPFFCLLGFSKRTVKVCIWRESAGCNKKKRIKVYISVELCIKVSNGAIQMGALETWWNIRTHLRKIKANNQILNIKTWFRSTNIDDLKHQLKFIQRYKKKCRKSGHSLWIIGLTHFLSSFHWIGIGGAICLFVCGVAQSFACI